MNLFKHIKRQRRLLTIRLVVFLSKLVNRQKQEYDVLLVKVDAIGDFVLWLDAFSAIEKKYAGKKIALMCNRHVLEIAKNFQCVSKIFSVKKHIGLGSLYRWAWKLQRYHFKEVINPVFSRTFSMDQLIRLINADEKVGFCGDASNMSAQDKRTCDAFYTRLIVGSSSNQSELLRNADFASQLCGSTFTTSLPNIRLLPQALQKNIPLPYCVFSLGAGSRKRCWDVQKFIELTKVIPSPISIVLIGAGKHERRFSKKFTFGVSPKRQVYDLTNRTTLVESLHVIKNALFTVGNDSAHIHISAALRTPSICIAGRAQWERFIPYAQSIPEQPYHPRVATSKFMDCSLCNWHCKYPLQNGKWKCIDETSVESVEEVLSKLLREFRIS